MYYLGEKDIGKDMKKKVVKRFMESHTICSVFPESISNSRDGDVGMSESEKLITESQNELKYGQPERALALVNRYLQHLSQIRENQREDDVEDFLFLPIWTP